MVLVLSGWDGSGRVAYGSVFAWKPSSDGHACKNPDCAGLGNQHATTNSHAPTQCHAYLILFGLYYKRYSHSHPTCANRYLRSHGRAARPSTDTDATASY